MSKKRIITFDRIKIEDRMREFSNVIYDEKQKPRGLVLVAASYLDLVLETLLRAEFNPISMSEKKSCDWLFKPNNPLGGFGVKIELCNALRLFDEWAYKDLKAIQTIRNDFAHNWEKIDFTTQEISDKTKNLSGGIEAIHALVSINIVPRLENPLEEDPDSIQSYLLLLQGQDKFTINVILLSVYLEYYQLPNHLTTTSS